jgi:serine/threonine protein kinase
MTDSQKTSNHTFQFSAGSIINKYQIIEPYAHGAFKEVYKVQRYAALPPTEDESELKDGLLTVVLKVFKRPAEITAPTAVQNLELIAEQAAADPQRKGVVYDDTRVQKFLQELESYMGLQNKGGHKNIAALLDFGVYLDKDKPEPAKLYFVEEFVEGETLTQMLSKLPIQEGGLRQLPVETATSIFSQVADGVQYLHSNNVAHRDIKGSNVIIKPNGGAVIIDLGNARIISAAEYIQYGSILYRSPEELIGESGGKPSDIWAMGLLMYEALTGVYPFQTATPDWSKLKPEEIKKQMVELKRNIAYSDALPVTNYNNLAPAEITQLIQKALTKNPQNRLDVTEFCATLASIIKAPVSE